MTASAAAGTVKVRDTVIMCSPWAALFCNGWKRATAAPARAGAAVGWPSVLECVLLAFESVGLLLMCLSLGAALGLVGLGLALGLLGLALGLEVLVVDG